MIRTPSLMLDHLRDQLGPVPEGLREVVQLRELERPAEDRVGEPGLLDDCRRAGRTRGSTCLLGLSWFFGQEVHGQVDPDEVLGSCQPPSCANSCEKGQPEGQNRRPGP